MSVTTATPYWIIVILGLVEIIGFPLSLLIVRLLSTSRNIHLSHELMLKSHSGALIVSKLVTQH